MHSTYARPQIDQKYRGEVEDFLYHEADLLDRGKFEDWLALFTADAKYWLPLHMEQLNGLDEASLIYDDRMSLETRVRRALHPHFYAQQPYSRTCHIISNVRILSANGRGGRTVVASNVLISEFRAERYRNFTGQCTHDLLEESHGNFKIAQKRIDIIDAGGTLEGITILI